MKRVTFTLVAALTFLVSMAANASSACQDNVSALSAKYPAFDAEKCLRCSEADYPLLLETEKLCSAWLVKSPRNPDAVISNGKLKVLKWDHVAAATLLTSDVASRADDPEIDFLLALIFGTQFSPIFDAEEALRYAQLAAEKDYEPALILMGRTYSEGLFGVEKDVPRAIGFFHRAEALGSVRAQEALMFIYRGSKEFPYDPIHFQAYQEEAAERGGIYAQLMLSTWLLVQRPVVKETLLRAKSMLEEAALSGSQSAVEKLEGDKFFYEWAPVVHMHGNEDDLEIWYCTFGLDKNRLGSPLAETIQCE